MIYSTELGCTSTGPFRTMSSQLSRLLPFLVSVAFSIIRSALVRHNLTPCPCLLRLLSNPLHSHSPLHRVALGKCLRLITATGNAAYASRRAIRKVALVGLLSGSRNHTA